MRVFALSDIHVDYDENLRWITGLSSADYQQDILILAGDVSDDIKVLGQVLSSVRSKFLRVLFVPGNHELWINAQDLENGLDSSLAKLTAIAQLCLNLGIEFSETSVEGVIFVPLYSWYDFSFGEPDKYLRRAWRDFRACKWPSDLSNAAQINAHFLSMNTETLKRLKPLLECLDSGADKRVISFSHFLPRIDLMPARIPQDKRRVYPVLGSELLDAQVRQIPSTLHIYGHSHVNTDIHLQGVRYVNNAFAYPTEARIARKSLLCVYDSQSNALPLSSSDKTAKRMSL